MSRPVLSAYVVVAALVAYSVVPSTALAAGGAHMTLAGSGSVGLPTPLGGPLVPARVAASDAVVPGSELVGTPGTSPLSLLVTLALSNQSALGVLLDQLSDPSSPAYHEYLSAAAFDARFSPSLAAWSGVLDYLKGFPITNLTTTPDRVSIEFDATPSVADEIFHTTISRFASQGRDYDAPSSVAELPSGVSAVIAQVEGLSTFSQYTIRAASEGSTLFLPRLAPSAPPRPTPPSGYLPPATYDGVQLEYAPDFQIAYDEPSLFQQYGYPTNATVATILWSGAYEGTPRSTACGPLTTGEDVGPWVPSDVYDFFNQTLPPGEPHPTVTAVPIHGAAEPSCLASWDSTEAVSENTIDLEMLGSTAPGAEIYNVYGPVATSAYVDDAFATILSPPTTLPLSEQFGLDNVSIISNSWAVAETNDSSWYQSLEQAQARGISVLASSGDSGDNPASTKYSGTTVEFPSSMAFDSFGTVAVGGTTVVLNPATLQLASQVVWNISASDVLDHGPAGSTGGISSLFPEPSWQASSEANTLLLGVGRGVPDLAANANNTLVTLSFDGVQYNATNASSGEPFVSVWGTSVACPLTAGLVAEIDHVLVTDQKPPLGFLDPELYAVANRQYAPLPSNLTGIGADVTGSYDYSLPTTPFSDVVTGANDRYSAEPGYDLVTGWGSLDAYNYTMYVLNTSSVGVAGRLSGVQDRLNLTGLDVSSAGVSFNASTQQNLFLANSLGAPVYWVQNVVYISGQPGAWEMGFTGWLVFPFYAAYPSISVYEYNVPAADLPESTPLAFNFTTQLTDPGSLGAEVTFSFGVPGASELALPAPGAAFIIGDLNYSYSWQGTTYTNGGPAYSADEGFLAPQFGLVGGPSRGVGDFLPPTGGNLSAWVEPTGSTNFVPAATQTFGIGATQTGEQAENLRFNQTSGNGWSIAVDPGNETQGVLAYEIPPPPEYPVQFNQTGVPGGTVWWVNITGGPTLSARGSALSISTLLPDGSYPWTLAVDLSYGTARPGNGTVIVNGTGEFVDIVFTLPNNTVTFQETGLLVGVTWSVAILGGGMLSGNTSSLGTRLLYGDHTFSVGEPDPTWTSSPRTGTFSVNATAPVVAITFARVVFALSLFPNFVGSSPVSWSIALGSTVVSGAGSRETIGLPNGTYEFNITVPPGYTAEPANGNFTIRAAPYDLVFTVVAPPLPGPFGEGVWGYALLGAIGVAVILLLLAFLGSRRSRSRPPRPSPPLPAGGAPPAPPLSR